MAVIKEIVENGAYTYTKSDNKKIIRQISTGNLYDEAYDLIEYPQEYEETDMDIELSEEE